MLKVTWKKVKKNCKLIKIFIEIEIKLSKKVKTNKKLDFLFYVSRSNFLRKFWFGNLSHTFDALSRLSVLKYVSQIIQKKVLLRAC